MGEGCPAALSLVEHETIAKLSRAVAIMVNVRRIVGPPLRIDSSFDRTPVIDCRE